MLADFIGFPPLIVLAVLSLAGIWSQTFNDNLIQRVGLCGVCFGSVMRMYSTLLGHDLSVPRTILLYGVAIFAVGVAVKFSKKAK